MSENIEYRILKRNDLYKIQWKGWLFWNDVLQDHMTQQYILGKVAPIQIAPTAYFYSVDEAQEIISKLRNEVREQDWSVV